MDAHTQGSRSAKRAVIYCYDGSEPSRHALEMGSAILGEAHAEVVCVWRSIWNTTAGLAYGVLPQDAVDAAETAAHQAAAALAEQGAALVDISTAVALRSDDSIWERILEYADSCDAGVIVVGSRGLSGIKSAVLGSVSHGLVNNSRRPVLVVPPIAVGTD